MYQSKGNKEIVGEAKIIRIDTLPASEVLSVYGSRLFLTQSEFEDYVGNRGDKKLLVLVLKGAKRYSITLRPSKSITMAGRYMTREMFRQIENKSRKAIDTKATVIG